MTTQHIAVVGMTCEHCVAAVRAELAALPGVTDVQIELVVGGRSQVQVTGEQPLSDQQLAAALDEAGDYRIG